MGSGLTLYDHKLDLTALPKLELNILHVLSGVKPALKVEIRAFIWHNGLMNENTFEMNACDQFCPNPACNASGQTGQAGLLQEKMLDNKFYSRAFL